MPKQGTTFKPVKTTANKSKTTSKPHARKSGDQPKKGIHHQKRPASDGNNDLDGSEAEAEAPRVRPRKKVRRVDQRNEVEVEEVIEEEEEEDNNEEVEGVDDNMGSEDVEQEQVSSL